MLPQVPNIYPAFVDNQLLTAENLNRLFDYLDEQERSTRTNLIGIGIVCGLEVSVNSSFNEITISKGVGITTQGHLVSWPGQSFRGFLTYNAVQPLYYDRFVKPDKTQRMDLDELIPASTEEGVKPLSKSYLEDKVVLMFVEMRNYNAKNCEPDSCDDKGGRVEIIFKPLLVNKKDAAKLSGGLAGNITTQNIDFIQLKPIPLPRPKMDAPLVDSDDVLGIYYKTLTPTFLKEVTGHIEKLFKLVEPIIASKHLESPSGDFFEIFEPILENTLPVSRWPHLQYYYDFLSDILKVYNELLDAVQELMCLCLPPDQYSRHLLLDLAIPDASVTSSLFRHYFIGSPVHCHQKNVADIAWQCQRMIAMVDNFKVPEVPTQNRKGTNIKITPSRIGRAPLGERAIPYYFKVNDGEVKLYQHWNFKKTIRNKANQILSYQASDYNTSDVEVLTPLNFDLEPFNFFRIEGHVGLPFTRVLADIKQVQSEKHLPFETIALSANSSAIREEIAAILKPGGIKALSEKYKDQVKNICTFQDLEVAFDVLVAEMRCQLCNQMQFFYRLPHDNNIELKTDVPAVTLLKNMAPNFRVTQGTIGQMFEIFWETVKDQNYISFEVAQNSFNANFYAAATNTNPNAGVDFSNFLLYYIEMLSQTLTSSLSTFSMTTFNKRFFDLQRMVMLAMSFLRNRDNSNLPDSRIESYLNSLIVNCKVAALNALVKNYYVRWLYVILLRKFGAYALANPGLEHKAGVTKGGTFIVVYHQEEDANIKSINQGSTIPDFHRDHTLPNVEILNRDPASEPINIRTEPETRYYTASKSKDETDNDVFARKLNQLSGNKFTVIDDLKNRTKSIPDKQEKTLNLILASVLKKEAVIKTVGLKNGAVIADFYLPYLCCSECPPIHYNININEAPTGTEEKPTISLERETFCNNDQKGYPISVAPEGGEITGEGLVKEDSGKSVFIPSEVKLGAVASKKIEIEYKTEKGSAVIEVEVFAVPVPQFNILEGQMFNHKVFENKSTHTDSVIWDFGDGDKSTENQAEHTYKTNGTFTVTLTATNGPCTATATQTLNIINEPTPKEKNCISLKDVNTAFQQFISTENSNMDVFKKNYEQLKDIIAFFKLYNSKNFSSVNEELNFLKEAKIEERLSKWITDLGKVISTNTKLAGLAILMLAILTEILMSIACKNEGDIQSNNTINLVKTFKAIETVFSFIVSLSDQLSGTDQKNLANIFKKIQTELKNMAEANEDVLKPNYTSGLKRLVKLAKK